MLVLSRRRYETIQIGDDVVITVTRIRPDAVRIGVTAPEGTRILRGELLANELPKEDESA